jgi:DNA-binding beta-propeller fold protein YncE
MAKNHLLKNCMRKHKRLINISVGVLIAVLAVGTWAFFHWLAFMLRKPIPASAICDWPMTVVAGDGIPGFADGHSPRFNKPIRLAPFGPDAVLVADIKNHAIRIVHLDGRTETIAGGPTRQGHLDGPADQARFDSPHGVAVRDDGAIAVAEAANNTIRLLIPGKKSGGPASTRYIVTTLAGKPGKKGYRDGPAKASLFSAPHSVVWGKEGELFVADIGNARLRKIKDGAVSTVAGTGRLGHDDGPSGTGSLQYPMDLCRDLNGHILISDAGTGLIRRYTPESGLSTPYDPIEIDMPHGLASTPAGDVIVAEMYAHRIVLLTSDNAVIRLCGTGEPGGSRGQLRKPAAVLIHSGYLWIADMENHRVVTAKWHGR